MQLHSWFWLLCAFSISSLALHESDAGVVDWHKTFIGVPLAASGWTAPKFVGDDIVITATSSNVLAAISAKDGSIVWRYIYDPEDPIAGFYDQDGTVVTLSGPGGAVIRKFKTATGALILEHTLHTNDLGVLVEPAFFGKSIAFSSESKDIFALTNAFTVTRLDNHGSSLWTWSAPDQTSKTFYFKLISTPEAVYVIGVSKSFASHTLQIITLSPTSGEIIKSRDIPSSVNNAVTDVSFVDNRAIILWVEGNGVKTLALDPKLTRKPTSVKGLTLAYLADVGLSNLGQFLSQKEDGSSKLLQLAADGSSFTSLHEFDDKPLGVFFAGGIDSKGNGYVLRSHWSHELKKIVIAVVGNGEAKDYTLPFDTDIEGVIDHIAFQVDADSRPHVVTTASYGTIQSFKAEELQWSRPEGLSTTVLAEFVELPERIAAESEVDKVEGYVGRLLRHAIEAQNLPHYLVNFVRRFVTGSYASATSPAVPHGQSDTLYRDTFGFRQIIVTATLSGKIYGIDSSNGKLLWSRALSLGSDFFRDVVITPTKMYVLKTVSDGTDPEVVVVAERRASNVQANTVLYHFNALTGDDAREFSSRPGYVEGAAEVQGTGLESFLLDEGKKTIVLLDESKQARVYPDIPESHNMLRDIHSRVSFPIHSKAQLLGHKFHYPPDANQRPAAYPVWTLNLPAGEEVQRILPPAHRGPVASLGKVLGNRTTLYKYLNPRLFTALTVAPIRDACGIYVIDSAKGSVIYHRAVKAHNGACDIQTALVENWLVYHYYESEAAVGNDSGSKGYRLVSVDLFEGQGADKKTRSSELTPFSNATTFLTAYEEAFVFPHAVSTLAFTSTKFRITSKDLIFATKNHKIQSFPRRYLDPRRPHRKPTSEESEEGLIQYDPLIPDDPKRVISHECQVANVKRIVTAPALLESTSLVFAYGLDMFLTRVAPSGTFDVLSETFNKAQLVITISGLALAIVFTRPMVQRKRLKEKWYQ